ARHDHRRDRALRSQPGVHGVRVLEVVGAQALGGDVRRAHAYPLVGSARARPRDPSRPSVRSLSNNSTDVKLAPGSPSGGAARAAGVAGGAGGPPRFSAGRPPFPPPINPPPDGTSSVLTRNVSMSTPSARPTP